MIQSDSAIISKTLELCKAICGDEEFQTLHKNVEAFLSDDQARGAYQALHEKGAELQDKQRVGIEITAQEMTDFEISREQLFENKTVTAFVEAQQTLQSLQKTVNDYLSLTIEMGKVPTAEEVAEASQGGGCCGGGSCGSGGGGCG